MDGGERRRMIKHAAGPQDKTKINQIMLRFRPIAPRPAAGLPDSDASSLNDKNLLVSKRRAKRKYVRVRRNKRFRKEDQKISSSSDQQNGKEIEDANFSRETTMATLQLLPEKSDKTKDSPERETWWCNQELSHHHNQDQEENLKLKQPIMVDGTDQTTAAVSRNKMESRVIVECVTETYGCMDTGSGRGRTDVERVKNLEEDTRPGFISDGSDKVRWVNGAYKKMIKKENDEKGQSAEIMVSLLTKQKLMPYIYCSGLTCWVRLEYRLGEKQKYNSKMVPCDVWRMDCGGFAWRLDVEAALSLSLACH